MKYEGKFWMLFFGFVFNKALMLHSDSHLFTKLLTLLQYPGSLGRDCETTRTDVTQKDKSCFLAQESMD